MTSWYVGLSTSGHDPALAIVDDTGRLRFAEATERVLQDKRAWGIAPDHVTHLAAALAVCGADPATDRFVVASTWAARKDAVEVKIHDAMLPGLDTLWMRGLQSRLQDSAGASLLRLGVDPERTRLLRFDHHLCHAASASYFAPVEDALCLVLDGEGDVGAVSLFRLQQRRLKRLWRSWGPGSLGSYYGWLTFHCGFDWRLGEEWKVMGLAAYGQVIPELLEALGGLLIVDRGRLRFAEDATIRRIDRLARAHARAAGDPVMQAADLAATGQAGYARFADRVLSQIADPALPDLVLSGGCALNSSYNGTIAGRIGFERVHIPPCPADDGNAIGAALLAWMQDGDRAAVPRGDGAADLGTAVAPSLDAKIAHAARSFAVSDLSGRSAQAVADALAKGKVLGVMRGRAEFGPRALGHRSILADPRPGWMKDRINDRVKGREAYRPFAPVLLQDDVANWFERPQPSPYMSMTLPWRPAVKERVPAVVHADGTGRLQSVTRDRAPWMADLLQALGQSTGVPVVLNTSFNVMGKPIIHSVEDALAVLATTGLDGVLCEDFLIEKPE